MVLHLRAVILTCLALSIGHVSDAAEFVPLGPGAWETSGSWRECCYGPPKEYVFPVGKTSYDGLPLDWNGQPRFPDGSVAMPPEIWEHGFREVIISDNGRVVTGQGTTSAHPFWFEFDEDGSASTPLINQTFIGGGSGVVNIDLTADGHAGLAARIGCCVSRDKSFGINGKISTPGLTYERPLPPELQSWEMNGMAGGAAISGSGNALIGVSSGGHAFRWSNADNRFQVLADMPTAVDLTYDGSIVVGGAKWWTEATGAQYFGPTPTPEFTYQSEAISADGTVIAGTMTVNGVREAFLWTQAGGFQGLGDLPGGIAESYVTGLSADGSTVIGMSLSNRGREPFRWNAATGMQSVIGLFNDGGADLQGYNLVEFALSNGQSYYYSLSGVSGDGTVLVGTSKNGAWLARIAIVPEPGAAMLALLAMLLPLHRSTTFRK